MRRGTFGELTAVSNPKPDPKPYEADLKRSRTMLPIPLGTSDTNAEITENSTKLICNKYEINTNTKQKQTNKQTKTKAFRPVSYPITRLFLFICFIRVCSNDNAELETDTVMPDLQRAVFQ